MAAPFVSRDGNDSEVWVQVGSGVITELERQNTDSPNVNVKVTVPGLERPIHGWLQKADPIYPKVVEAFEQKREIAYRTESQRKKHVDPKAPIRELRATMEIAKENTLNLFAAIDGELAAEAVTLPAQDHKYAGARRRAEEGQDGSPAAAGGAGLSMDAALAGLAEGRKAGLPEAVVNASMALALAAGATAKQVADAGVAEQGPKERREVQRGFSMEAAPHIVSNTDGRENLGSYQVQAAFAAENVAYDLIEKNAISTAAKVNATKAEGEAQEPVQSVNLSQALGLAKVLLSLADKVQIGAYGGGRVNRMANSHTRARALVFDAIRKRFPVPFGAAPDQRVEWEVEVVAEATERFVRLAQIAFEVSDFTMAEPKAQVPDQGQAAAGPVEGTAGSEQAPGQPVQTEPVPEPGKAGSDKASGPVEAAEQKPQPVPEQSGPVPAQEAPQPASQASGAKQKPPVEGQDGFIAPDSDTLARFGVLATSAGFQANPESPVLSYLEFTFGVRQARKIHGPALKALTDWYAGKGDEAPSMFAAKVNETVGQPA